MSFYVDVQTLDDLNMLGEYRVNSTFNLFNNTITRGGKQMLEEMFRQPLNDAFGDYINCSYIISTHIIEAGHSLSGVKLHLHFVYMPTNMSDDIPTCPYRLADGNTDDRHGMIIIKNEKILEIIKRE